ncbi:MAG: glycolate oxidase subunit GlcE [Caulobacteraceae bacterium]|nr:glycolate oxidase subunit GlcE [Caulobacteraceae bacterium]
MAVRAAAPSTPSGSPSPANGRGRIEARLDADLSEALAEAVRSASERGAPLRIVGGDTKGFYGRRVDGEVLDVSGHRGVVAYEPSELVITARAGTPIGEIEALLAAHGQTLAFEPPVFGAASTLGGVVAAGLSGPTRPFAGAVRDCVLGVTVLDGRGRALRLGGVVFKNVAGFDGFRLMAGALGCLGVLLDVSLRVVPTPRAEMSLAFEEDWPAGASRITALMRRPLPLSAAFHDGERLMLRLSGPEAAVRATAGELGGEAVSPGFWDGVRHMTFGLLAAPRLWRLSVPRGATIAGLDGRWLMDWGGAQRWLVTDELAEAVCAAAAAASGHATLFRGAAAGEAVFTRLPRPLFELHRRLKAAFDPAGVFNPGRMYEGL